MNRLILIGNGFDLAHGLETSFESFIANYLLECFIEFAQKRNYDDQLINLKCNYYNRPFYSRYDFLPDNVVGIVREIEKSHEYEIEFKSQFFNKIFKKFSQLSWVDLEIEFFESLVENKDGSGEYWDLRVKEVNSDLEFLRGKLIAYLKNEFERNTIQPSVELANCFTDYIKKDEVRTIQLDTDIKPENLYFLNFNYTETLTKYFVPNAFNNTPYEFNYIHGDLNLISADPIFGFGDELDKNYKEFEDHKNKELFKHIKSFHYLMSSNYFSLIRFIDSGDFQVHIYGHSCGLSDRTMLNQIFEHENCKSIKIYYHKIDETRNDFTDKTYDIARHFTDKVVFRRKLVPFPMSVPMPQPSKNE